MDGYVEQSTERRRLICEQAEEQLDLPAASLEKDYWVCWTLRELFGIPDWGQIITFKGGTSLSKCWSLINRFSEDIDIVIDKGFLGFAGEESPEEAPSRKQKKKRLDAMRKAAQGKIHDDLAPALEARIGASLPSSDTWELSPASENEDRDRQTLLFKYPSAMANTEAYVPRVVKIEMGARSDNEPVEEKEVHAYLFDAFPDVLGPSKFRVRALAAERTFWEKASVCLVIVSAVIALIHWIDWNYYFQSSIKWLKVFVEISQVFNTLFRDTRDLYCGSEIWFLIGCAILLSFMIFDKYVIMPWRSGSS